MENDSDTIEGVGAGSRAAVAAAAAAGCPAEENPAGPRLPA